MKKFKIIFLMIVFIFITGCASFQCRPDPDDYSNKECFKEADCYYRNKDTENKTECADWGKECRAIIRYNFCKKKENRPTEHDFEKCWIYRNQK